jgi:adenylosuccinate lyase
LLATSSTSKGLGKLEVNHAALAEDLDKNWAVIGEAIQTVMRRHGIAEPYEKLKQLTRGHRHIDQEVIKEFVNTLELPDDVRDALGALTPGEYIGLARELAARKEK